MRRAVICLVVLASLIAASVTAEGPVQSKGRAARHAEHGAAAQEEAAHGFNTRQRKIIVDWFAEPRNLEGLPPGLAKREELPPGLRRHIEKNGTLPPGLEKKLQPFPDRLDSLLPPRRAGTRRVILGGDVLLLDERTSAILDVIHDVIRLKQTF